jgi:hypothetical protein
MKKHRHASSFLIISKLILEKNQRVGCHQSYPSKDRVEVKSECVHRFERSFGAQLIKQDIQLSFRSFVELVKVRNLGNIFTTLNFFVTY